MKLIKISKDIVLNIDHIMSISKEIEQPLSSENSSTYYIIKYFLVDGSTYTMNYVYPDVRDKVFDELYDMFVYIRPEKQETELIMEIK